MKARYLKKTGNIKLDINTLIYFMILFILYCFPIYWVVFKNEEWFIPIHVLMGPALLLSTPLLFYFILNYFTYLSYKEKYSYLSDSIKNNYYSYLQFPKNDSNLHEHFSLDKYPEIKIKIYHMIYYNEPFSYLVFVDLKNGFPKECSSWGESTIASNYVLNTIYNYAKKLFPLEGLEFDRKKVKFKIEREYFEDVENDNNIDSGEKNFFRYEKIIKDSIELGDYLKANKII